MDGIRDHEQLILDSASLHPGHMLCESWLTHHAIVMNNDYTIYDSLYEEARRNGWQGWGGDARIATGPAQVARIVDKPFVPKAGRALELGCGEGHLCRLLAARGYSVTGVDVSSQAIAWALEKRSAEEAIAYIQGDLCQPGILANERFVLIVDGNCLHCILDEDRPFFLRNVRRLLSEQGIFFVSSLCTKDDRSITLSRAGRPYRHVPSVACLLQELAEAQFEIVEWEVRERNEHDHISVFARRHG